MPTGDWGHAWLRGLPSIFLIFVVSFPSVVLALWEGKKDNKSVAELELMNHQELLFEAINVCATVATDRKVAFPERTPQRLRQLTRVVEGLEYIELIKRVARKQNTGEIPQWMNEIAQAAGSNDPLRCNEPLRRFLEEQRREKEKQKDLSKPPANGQGI